MTILQFDFERRPAFSTCLRSIPMAEPKKLLGEKSQVLPPQPVVLKNSQICDDPEQFISAFMDCASVGLAIVDRQLRFRVVNHALAEMNGVNPRLHLGRTIGEILGGA